MEAAIGAAEHQVMGPLFTRVSFRVRCPETRFGESVAVCGELPEFGGWDPAQALQLHTSADTFPIWQSDTVLIGSYVSCVQFKFVIIPADGGVVGAPVRWEQLPCNRQFSPVGEELSLLCEYGVLAISEARSNAATPELSALDVSAPDVTASLELPQSLAEVARRARAPALANPLDGRERVLIVMHRLPLQLSRDEATGAWSARWDEGSMWATSVDGGRPALSSIGCATVFVGSPGRPVPSDEQSAVTALLAAHGCIPVYIDPWELNESFGQYTKHQLWPLLHFELPALPHVQLSPSSADAGAGGAGTGSSLAGGGGAGASACASAASMPCGPYRAAKEQWEAYKVVNQLFANVLKAQLRARDMVWVHGHHLLLVPERVSRECRERHVPIGLFVHTPFPSVAVFSALPQRKVVLEAMLHAHIIGFHLYEYARNFLIASRRLLGLVEPTKGTQHMSSGMLGLEVNSRQVVISISHVGIEPSIVKSRLGSDEVQAAVRRLRDKLDMGGRVVIGGVEWLASMQGAPIKLMAYESLLENYAKYRGAVTLLQVGVPVAGRASDLGADVQGTCRVIAARIRQRFGAHALQYIEVGFAPSAEQQPATSELEIGFGEWCVSMRVAVWTLLDVLVVTATRDGLNLLPFEYVCARRLHAGGGVCVLSEFAGCSRVLNGAIRVNPFSLSSVVEAIDRALSLDRRDAEARMAKDWAFLDAHTTSSWVQLFVRDLKRVLIADDERNASVLGGEGALATDGVPAPGLGIQVPLPRKLEVEPLVRAYRAASRRVFCFGLDGTLIPQDTVITHLKENHDFVGRGQAPSPAVLHCLRALASDPANEVHVLSGRGSSDMSAILGSFERLGLSAELGYLRRAPGKSAWERCSHGAECNQWRQEAKAVMHWFTTRTNGSYSRWQQSAAVWCYHDADPDFGRYQGKQLHAQLVQQLGPYPVSVVHSLSKRTVEVRIRAVNKGLTVDSILCQPANRQADFVLCCGDDHSDEYMFSAAIARARAPLPPVTSAPAGAQKGAPPSRRTFNVTVGRKLSRAALYVEDTRQVLFFLQALTQHAITGALGRA